MTAGNSIHLAGARAGMATGMQAVGRTGYGLQITQDTGNPLTVEIVLENGPNGWEKWFQVYFDFPSQLAGNARDGYQDETLKLAIRLQRSEDVQTWDHAWRDMGSVAVPGGWRYRARSIYPVDSAIKTGTLTCGFSYGGDARNNPITSITIGGVAQALPNYPYVMPVDAAQLQSDLRAAGWTGATVTASSDVIWIVTIPDFTSTGFNELSRVSWPVWYSVTPVGTQAVDGMDFDGIFLNSASVRTWVRAQFARLAITTLQCP